MVHPCSTAALFDLTKTQAAPLLSGTTFPWEALAGLETFIFQLGESLDPQQYERLGDYVWAAKRRALQKAPIWAGPASLGRAQRCATVHSYAVRRW